MIDTIVIENYKSIEKIEINLGRFNVLIGENGCGKSNILEAITLFAAAESNKLDNEFLSSRGIRVTSPALMRSCFTTKTKDEPIEIKIIHCSSEIMNGYRLHNDNKPYSKWTIQKGTGIPEESLATHIKEYLQSLEVNKKKLNKKTKLNDDIVTELRVFIESLKADDLDATSCKHEINNFMIYSPENTALKSFHKEGQVEPLGINGEGLLKLLSTIQSSGNVEVVNDINNALGLFGWFKDIKVPETLSESEDKVIISDRYIIDNFDQRSANEGFLFVLFYVALMVSEDTPKIFAIDNIDASLNPKLCTKLITELIKLSKKYDKQVIVTTHNPGILDGIDLSDKEQRLLVISRNKKGNTQCKRIDLEDKPKSSTGETLKLSEALLRGYVGGLPKGF